MANYIKKDYWEIQREEEQKQLEIKQLKTKKMIY